MVKRLLSLLLVAAFLISLAVLASKAEKTPAEYDTSGFVLLSTAAPEIVQEIRYATTDNFVGRKINGYEQGVAILSRPAAKALKRVAADVEKRGIKV